MKTNKYLVFVLGFFAILMMLSDADAQTQRERKGFVIGLGVGGGAVDFSGEREGSMLLDFRIGGGLSENVVLMAEILSASADDDYSTTNFSAQFFIQDDFYLRPGIGLGYYYDNTGGDDEVLFSGILSAGKEFRTGEMFALSPELTFNYSNTRGDTFIYGARLGMLWYF